MLAFSFADIYNALGVPITWLLDRLTEAFQGLGFLDAIGPFGLAVIATTLVIRVLLSPLFAWQLRTQRRVQREQRLLAPQMTELRKKYRREPQKLSQEMQKLYREHGVSPFSSLSGCLPLLVQMPILFALYGGIRNATKTQGHAGFLWMANVSESAWQQAGSHLSGVVSHPAIAIVPLLAAALTFVQSRMMMPPLRPDMTDQERSMAEMSRSMSSIIPLVVAFSGFILPQGLALYWVTNSFVLVVQQYWMMGWGGMKVPVWLPGASRTTALSHPPESRTTATAVANKNGNDKKEVEGTPVGVAVRNPSATAPKKRKKRR